MKKKLLLILSFICILTLLFTSCGLTELEEAELYVNTHDLTPEEPYLTFNLYLPCSAEMSESTINSMQLEFNSVIESLYRTRIIFHFVKEDEYVSKVNEQLEVAKTAKENGTVEDTSSKVLGDHFPSEASYQMDMFVTTSKSMLDSMISAGSVVDLTSYMTSTYNRKLGNQKSELSIYDLIYQNGCKIVTETDPSTEEETTTRTYHSVPSNFQIGSYTYYVIEKQYAEEHYYSVDSSKTVAERIKTLSKLSDFNDHVTEVTGDYLKRYDYSEDEYIVEVKSTPILTDDELYQCSFCISSYCQNVDRAMEVLVELFTNKNLHTTLQYGAKGVTYRLLQDDNGDSYVQLIEDAPVYTAIEKYLGNIMVQYPCPERDVTNDSIHAIYLQNCDASIAE